MRRENREMREEEGSKRRERMREGREVSRAVFSPVDTFPVRKKTTVINLFEL